MTRSRPDYNFLGVTVGVIVFLIGAILVSKAFPEAESKGPVHCAGKEMHPGDVCTVFGGGNVDISAKNYETMAAEQLSGRGWSVWLLCLGILVSVGAVIVTGLYISYVRSLARKSS